LPVAVAVLSSVCKSTICLCLLHVPSARQSAFREIESLAHFACLEWPAVGRVLRQGSWN